MSNSSQKKTGRVRALKDRVKVIGMLGTEQKKTREDIKYADHETREILIQSLIEDSCKLNVLGA